MAPSMDTTPWYREPWPWILLAGPALVIVASIITYVIAVRNDDALVVGNYYKEGLAINRLLRAEEAARTRGLSAKVRVTATGALSATIVGAEASLGAVRVRFIHPTDPRRDRTIALTHGDSATWHGQMEHWMLQVPRWHVLLEDADRSWRLKAQWLTREAAEFPMTASADR